MSALRQAGAQMGEEPSGGNVVQQAGTEDVDPARGGEEIDADQAGRCQQRRVQGRENLQRVALECLVAVPGEQVFRRRNVQRGVRRKPNAVP